MKSSYLVLFYLLITPIFPAQVQGDFRYFLDKSVQDMYKDPKRSLEFSQNFLLNNKNSDHKILFQNTVAQAYTFQGDYLNAISSFPQSEEIKKGNSSKFFQFYIDYCLADQYQNLGLYNRSQKVIHRILSQNNFPNNPETNVTIAKLHQLNALCFAILKKYDQAISDFEKSNTFLKEKNEQNEILKTENQLYIGICKLNQKKISEAETIFTKVSNGETAKKYDFLYAQVREYLARVKFLQQKPQESIVLLEDALQKIENKNYATFKLNIYDAFSKAYLAQNNTAKYHEYQTLAIQNKAKIDDNKKAAIGYLVNIIEEVNNGEVLYHKNQSNSTTKLILLLSIALVAILSAVYYFLSRKEKDLNKQLDFFENSQLKRKETTEGPISEKEPNSDAENKKTNLLSTEKEKELIEKLDAFEHSELFLSNQMSLPVLAAELDTNIKYLSEIIKNFKHKKFNAYINDLRIQYIVNKLKTDPAYLHYKVSYLAEATGFSSHSAFTAVFKSITGISPNDFIQQINQLKK